MTTATTTPRTGLSMNRRAIMAASSCPGGGWRPAFL
jgi:hypothetical protein